MALEVTRQSLQLPDSKVNVDLFFFYIKVVKNSLKCYNVSVEFNVKSKIIERL